MSRVRYVATFALTAAAACHRAENGTQERAADTTATPPVALAAARDTLRGVLTAVGSEPLVALVLTTARGERVVLTAPAGREAHALHNVLRAVLGLELYVQGTRTTERSASAGPQPMPVFTVTQFLVRSADGHAAYDGVVSRKDSAFSLLLADGRRVAAPRLPRALQAKIGARVYVAGPLDAPPISYGIISANQPPI